jgi:REP element-mobilizing transposase RayT
MLIQPYSLNELRFAFCNRVFFRTRTHRRKTVLSLTDLSAKSLDELLQPYDIRLLEFESKESDVQGLLSLKPTESISTAISKTKGRISKWLTESILSDGSQAKQKHLAVGYFAVTIGSTNASVIEEYLEKQSEHHGYADRARPPICVQAFQHSECMALETDHAVTVLRYHLVLATEYRRGVFTHESARDLTERWLKLQDKFLIDKVSFLPDHVHVAVTVHSTTAPADVALVLMNSGQEFIWRQYPHLAVRAKVERLWKPSAYAGSFGDLTSNAVRAYMHRWSAG